ncbi:MAG: peptidase M14, partial [Bryobacterales bacterium]|nr:peptidase M14 [Bryobacterales bacterium]
YPIVFVDLHEMGSDSTYYFAPEADPFNPHLSKDLMESLQWVGKNNAKWFDQFGFSYFTREVYDNFYPGYGASWPCYYGGVAMTYEQASSRGLLMRKTDGTEFHFRETVRQHFVASLSTLETSARYREKLIEKFYKFRQSAIEEGSKEPVREYVFPRSGNVSAVDKLASVLAEQGVEVRRFPAPFKLKERELPAGSYAVSLAQPSKRLIRVLLDKQVPMEADFLKEQERRRARKLPDEIYDVTGWSLPLLYNVEMLSSDSALQGAAEMVKPGEMPKGKITGGPATVAYLVPWGTNGAGKLLIAALRQGYKAWSSDKAFTQNGRKYPAGTLIFKVKENPESMAAAMAKLASETGVEVFATDTGWVDDGVNFGSRYVVPLRKPSIALAWDTPTGAGAAGHTRFVLERQYSLPVTPVRTRQLAFADLSRFHVIILPDTGFGGDSYRTVFGETGARRLKDWVGSGGTLVAIGGALTFLADPKVGLLSVSQENRVKPGDPSKKKEPEARVPGQLFTKQEDFDKAIQADTELPDPLSGVLAKAKLDHEHWMSAGMGDTVSAMVDGRAIFTPVKLDAGFNTAFFVGPEEVVASGYMWEENRKQ